MLSRLVNHTRWMRMGGGTRPERDAKRQRPVDRFLGMRSVARLCAYAYR